MYRTVSSYSEWIDERRNVGRKDRIAIATRRFLALLSDESKRKFQSVRDGSIISPGLEPRAYRTLQEIEVVGGRSNDVRPEAEMIGRERERERERENETKGRRRVAGRAYPPHAAWSGAERSVVRSLWMRDCERNTAKRKMERGLPGQAVCVLIDQHCCRIRLQRDGHIDWQSVSPGHNEACPPGKRFANANTVAPASP